MKLILLLLIAWTFPHNTHFKNGVDCSVCHEKALTSEKSSDFLLPSPDNCLDCHESAMGYVKPKPGVPLISHFSHKFHVKKTKCTSCHVDPKDPQLPKMLTCFNCHNGAKATTDCYACHEKGEKRLVEYHPPRWKSLHSVEARTNEDDCLLCHKESQGLLSTSPAPACEDCHVRENITLRRHPENFLFQHAEAFYTREENCSNCHENFNSCRTCHRERGLYPMDHNNLRWLTFTGGEHGEEAKSDPERCLLCHGGDEPKCAKCHGGR